MYIAGQLLLNSEYSINAQQIVQWLFLLLVCCRGWKRKRELFTYILKRSQHNRIKYGLNRSNTLGKPQWIGLQYLYFEELHNYFKCVSRGPGSESKIFLLLSCSVKAVRRVTLEQIQICESEAKGCTFYYIRWSIVAFPRNIACYRPTNSKGN